MITGQLFCEHLNLKLQCVILLLLTRIAICLFHHWQGFGAGLLIFFRTVTDGGSVWETYLETIIVFAANHTEVTHCKKSFARQLKIISTGIYLDWFCSCAWKEKKESPHILQRPVQRQSDKPITHNYMLTIHSAKPFEMKNKATTAAWSVNPGSCDMTSFKALLSYVNKTDNSSAMKLLEVHTWVIFKWLCNYYPL